MKLQLKQSLPSEPSKGHSTESTYQARFQRPSFLENWNAALFDTRMTSGNVRWPDRQPTPNSEPVRWARLQTRSRYTQLSRHPHNARHPPPSAAVRNDQALSVVAKTRAHQQSTASTANMLSDKGPTNTNAGHYRPGMIIQTLFTTPNIDPNVDVDDPSIGYISKTGYTSGKYRPMVVMSIYETHIKCIPMYTSGGSGFAKKPAAVKAERVRIRHCAMDPKEWSGSTPGDYLMVVNTTTFLKEAAYVNWTRVYDVDYQWPIAILGALTEVSFGRLRRMWTLAIQAGFLPVPDQSANYVNQLRNINVWDECAEMKRNQLSKKAEQRKKQEAQARDPYLTADGFQVVERKIV